MAYIDNLKNTWNQLGEHNALWAVLSDKKDWNEKEFFATGRAEIKQVLNTLKKNGVTVNLGRAMDFGSGVGRLSQALGKEFKQVTGVDIADSMIERANKYNKQKNVTFKHVTSGDLKAFKDRTYDFVFTDIVFQHMRTDFTKKYLKEMYRVLKKDGVLVFQLPSRPAKTWKGLLISTVPHSVLTPLRKGMEMHPIKKDQVLEYLRKLGYEIITVEKDTNHKHWHAYFYYARKP